MTQSGNSKNPISGLGALTNRELKKWYKNPILLVMTTIVQPIIWLGLFGKAMNIGAIFSSVSITFPQINPPLQPTQLVQLSQYFSSISTQIMEKTFGTLDYFSFMSVGMLSFIVLFTCMFSGMSIVWDRRLGFLNKVLSTPVARSSIILSKVLSTAIRSLVQAGIVLSLAYLLGLKLGSTFTPVNLLGVFAALFLISVGLSSIFILIAIRSTRQETQMAVMNLLNLPLLFASNALFPISIMPTWLQTIASINPISYATDAVRQLIILPIDVPKLIADFTFLGVFALVFVCIGTLLSWRYLNK